MAYSLKKFVEEIKPSSWAKAGTSFFALLNVIIVSIGLLFSLLVLHLYIYEAITHTDKVDTFMWSVCLSSNFIALVSMVFAVLLYLGINREKPYFVLAYIIFGIKVLIGICSGLAIFFYQDKNSYMNEKFRELFWKYYEPLLHTVVGLCVVYALVLTMIGRAWFLMTFRRSDDHEKLINDYYESDWKTES